MAGELKRNLAALARIKVSSLSEGVDQGGKILVSVVENVAVCEVAYPVRGYGYSPRFILEFYSLLQHPGVEYVGIAGEGQVEAHSTTDIYRQTAHVDKLVLNSSKEVEETVGLYYPYRTCCSLMPEREDQFLVLPVVVVHIIDYGGEILEVASGQCLDIAPGLGYVVHAVAEQAGIWVVGTVAGIVPCCGDIVKLKYKAPCPLDIGIAGVALIKVLLIPLQLEIGLDQRRDKGILASGKLFGSDETAVGLAACAAGEGREIALPLPKLIQGTFLFILITADGVGQSLDKNHLGIKVIQFLRLKEHLLADIPALEVFPFYLGLSLEVLGRRYKLYRFVCGYKLKEFIQPYHIQCMDTLEIKEERYNRILSLYLQKLLDKVLRSHLPPFLQQFVGQREYSYNLSLILGHGDIKVRNPVSYRKEQRRFVKEYIVQPTALKAAYQGIIPAGAVNQTPLGTFHKAVPDRGCEGIYLPYSVGGLKKRQIRLVIGAAQKLNLLVPLHHLGNKGKDLRMLLGKPFIPKAREIEHYRNGRIPV